MKPIDILLVEDSPSDVLITREALSEARLAVNLHVVEDGVKAMDFLHRRPPYEQAPRPALVLLDLNLPRKDGREVLAEMKADPGLKTVPVVVLTTSQAQEDVLRTYRLHANCYVTKPVDFGSFQRVIQAIENFWFTVVTLPRSV